MRANVEAYLLRAAMPSAARKANGAFTCRLLSPPPFLVTPSTITFDSSSPTQTVTVQLRDGGLESLQGHVALGYVCVVAEESLVMRAVPVRGAAPVAMPPLLTRLT